MNGAVKFGGGSKEKLVRILAAYLPPIISGRYIEPFIGSGALFFFLRILSGGAMPLQATGTIISDRNARLINFFMVLKNNLLDLIVALTIHQHEYMKPGNQKTYFHKIREEINRAGTPLGDTQQAANFYFLMRTCHCGLYRESKVGNCNSTFAYYKSPVILDIDHLTRCSLALADVIIRCFDFEHISKIASAGDLLYCDPPYDRTFSNHTAAGFNLADHKRLRNLCDEMTTRDVNVVISNSDTDVIRRLYSASHYNIYEVIVRRSIGNKHGVGGPVQELVITNFSAGAGTAAVPELIDAVIKDAATLESDQDRL